MGLTWQPAGRSQATTSGETLSGMLHETPLPPRRHRQGQATGTFRAHKGADYAANDARNRALGLAGELLVLTYEQASLRQHQRPDLAAKVRHVSAIEGDGAGYDILSYTPDGTVKYIEVKTTRGDWDSAFYMTSNEVAFAEQHGTNYYLYRVYEFDQVSNTGKLYVSGGSIEASFRLAAMQYRVVPEQ
jgi:hypothetical protein